MGSDKLYPHTFFFGFFFRSDSSIVQLLMKWGIPGVTAFETGLYHTFSAFIDDRLGALLGQEFAQKNVPADGISDSGHNLIWFIIVVSSYV